MIDEAIGRVEEGGGDARSKLERLLTLASSEQARALGSIDLAIREWARRDQAVRWRLGRVDNRRMEYMRSRNAASDRPPIRPLGTRHSARRPVAGQQHRRPTRSVRGRRFA